MVSPTLRVWGSESAPEEGVSSCREAQLGGEMGKWENGPEHRETDATPAPRSPGEAADANFVLGM